MAPACEPKGHRFDSWSGHMPGLQAKSMVGSVQEAINQSMLLSHIPVSLPLSKNKLKEA